MCRQPPFRRELIDGLRKQLGQNCHNLVSSFSATRQSKDRRPLSTAAQNSGFCDFHRLMVLPMHAEKPGQLPLGEGQPKLCQAVHLIGEVVGAGRQDFRSARAGVPNRALKS